jgi:hypothetical protein
MPFENRYHGSGTPPPRDLGSRIEAELRTRIEDAVDYACLGAMVDARRARGAPVPVADRPEDREEFLARVRAFLQALRAAIVRDLTDDQRRRVGAATALAPGDLAAEISAQVALARELPDYWQRFDICARSAGETWASRGDERRGLLDRLLGRS